jgi:hypothetical protein
MKRIWEGRLKDGSRLRLPRDEFEAGVPAFCGSSTPGRVPVMDGQRLIVASWMIMLP